MLNYNFQNGYNKDFFSFFFLQFVDQKTLVDILFKSVWKHSVAAEHRQRFWWLLHASLLFARSLVWSSREVFKRNKKSTFSAEVVCYILKWTLCLKRKAVHQPAAGRNSVLFIENFIYHKQKACENNLRPTFIDIVLSSNSAVLIIGFPLKGRSQGCLL